MELSEKYRPKTLEEVVGQDEIIESIKARDTPKNYLFVGPSGCGKTTLAQIIAKRYGMPLIERNASDERGINAIRDDIKRLTLTRGKKYIFLDEADSLTTDAQNALRRIMENPKSNSYFILTGNDGWRFEEAIKSRCTDFEFKRIENKDILRQIVKICEKEKIEIDEESEEGFIQLIAQSNGDMRKAINILEKVVNKDKKVTKRTVMSFIKPRTSLTALSTALEGDFEKAKSLIEDAYLENRYSPKHIIKELYESIEEVKEKEWRVLLYRELANVERSVKRDADPILPLIQLVGFIAYVWIIPHFPDSQLGLKK